MALEIYLIRHGQNEDNANGILNGHRDLPLTALGEQQAIEIATAVKEMGIRFDAMYSSPLTRARKTADIVASVSDQPNPVDHPLLIERDFGVMSGVPVSEIEARCAPDIIKTEIITYFLSPEGGETFPDLIIRSQRILDDVKASHPDGKVLLVGHGDTGKMIYAAYYNLPWQDVLVNFHFGNSEMLLLSPDSAADQAHLVTIEQHNH